MDNLWDPYFRDQISSNFAIITKNMTKDYSSGCDI